MANRTATGAQKYWVKMAWRFNLESMNDKLWCVIYDVEEGKLVLPVEIAGTTCRTVDDIYALKEECAELCWASQSRRVTGKEYGRIKQIVNWRVYARYATCVASGMEERFAGECFADL